MSKKNLRSSKRIKTRNRRLFYAVQLWFVDRDAPRIVDGTVGLPRIFSNQAKEVWARSPFVSLLRERHKEANVAGEREYRLSFVEQTNTLLYISTREAKDAKFCSRIFSQYSYFASLVYLLSFSVLKSYRGIGMERYREKGRERRHEQR